MLIDLAQPQKIVVCGFNQSGKTTLVKYLLKNYSGKVFIYDWHNEYKDMPNNCITYVPKMRYDDEKRIQEYDLILKRFFNNSNTIKVGVIDESNEYNPNMKSLPFATQDLYDNHAHYKQTIVFITRRPVDINTKLIELAHIRIFFKLFGANDIDYLNRLRDGLGETVSNLLPFHFALLDTFGNVKVCSPISL